MTLDEMYIETAAYCDENITKTNGVYTGESLKIVNKFKSAINYAFKKICREKYLLEYAETVSSGSPLTKTFFKLVSLKEAGTDNNIDYEVVADTVNYDYDGQVDIVYCYIPDELANLTDVPELPSAAVDHKILCYYAAFQYLMMEQDSNASAWLNMWNDGFESIRQAKTKITRVKNVYDLGW